LRNIDAVLGVTSLGLAAVAKQGHKAISLLYLIGIRNEELRGWWRQWTDRHSDGRVLFPGSISEVLAMVESGTD